MVERELRALVEELQAELKQLRARHETDLAQLRALVNREKARAEQAVAVVKELRKDALVEYLLKRFAPSDEERQRAIDGFLAEQFEPAIVRARRRQK